MAHLAGALYDAGDDEDAHEGGAHAAQPEHQRKLRIQQVRKAEGQCCRRRREEHLRGTDSPQICIDFSVSLLQSHRIAWYTSFPSCVSRVDLHADRSGGQKS